ncbi:MAG TPA: ubiquinone/menaquinone biosynthesis methyltransferase [Gemmatimonadales bacterium]|nr:ubiquinone/menaquinone biosynthesis methyltransferase [Gemmatimonadales bacterium]
MLATDRKLPVSGGAEKRSYVRGMFHAIAPSYDFLNHLLSLNLDKRWRRKAVERLNWERVPDGTYIDLCAGTLDLAATLVRQPRFAGWVVGSDFVPRMLQLGRGKAPRIACVTADALALPHADAAFDGATVGFGVRNLMDLDAGLREAARVLRPGARFVILEMSIPPWQPLRGLFLLYFRHLLPAIGRLVSHHSNAYTWLPESVLAFPEPKALAARMTAAGFREVSWSLLFGGICALHVGVRA